MAFREENQDVMQNIEAVIVYYYRKNPEMTDYTAITALEAAIEHYRAEMRGHEGRKIPLSGKDRELYEQIREICDWRLGKSIENSELPEIEHGESHEKIIECLRAIHHSAQNWNKSNGRQGYLNFVSKYIP